MISPAYFFEFIMGKVQNFELFFFIEKKLIISAYCNKP
jgi:hypothetical protein